MKRLPEFDRGPTWHQLVLGFAADVQDKLTAAEEVGDRETLSDSYKGRRAALLSRAAQATAGVAIAHAILAVADAVRFVGEQLVTANEAKKGGGA